MRLHVFRKYFVFDVNMNQEGDVQSDIHVLIILKIFADHMNKEKLCMAEAPALCLKVRRNLTPRTLKLLGNKKERAR